MIGAHSEIAMAMEDLEHGICNAVGVKVWANKLCTPNQIRMEPQPANRTLWIRIEDALRAFVGRPRWTATTGSVANPPFYETPRHRQVTYRHYVEDFGAHVVVIIRDPNANLHSMHQKGSSLDTKDRWSNGMHQLISLCDYCDPLILTFEGVLRQPEHALSVICRHIGVEYEENMTKGFKYTPQYNFDEINTSSLSREYPDYNLKKFDPKAVAIYNDLKSRATL
jgi:hypothetical protein